MRQPNKEPKSNRFSRRTPNCKCVICETPLYRRPGELAKARYVTCAKHRSEALLACGLNDAQLSSLSKGRGPGRGGRPSRPHSAETKEKIKLANQTYWRENPEAAKARGAKNRGAQHYQWAGGVNEFNQSIRRMVEYRKWAAAVRARDSRCVTCGATSPLEAHHLSGLSLMLRELGIETRDQARNEPELWKLENGVTLCRKCHYAVHGRNKRADK